MPNGAYGSSAFRLAKSILAALAGSIRLLRASLATSDRVLKSHERPKSSDKAAQASPTGDFR